MKDCRKHFGGKDIKAGIINRIAAFISVSLVRFVYICIVHTVDCATLASSKSPAQ